MRETARLGQILEGWNGYQASLVHAVEPLTAEQLAWRPSEERRCVGELVRHVALGRITSFARMSGPGLEQAMARVPRWYTDGDGSRHAVEESVPANSAHALVEWLHLSWEPIHAVLDEWTADDLSVTFKHRFWEGLRGIETVGVVADYVSRCSPRRPTGDDARDAGHPGGELGKLGGHIIEPPLSSEPSTCAACG